MPVPPSLHPPSVPLSLAVPGIQIYVMAPRLHVPPSPKHCVLPPDVSGTLKTVSAPPHHVRLFKLQHRAPLSPAVLGVRSPARETPHLAVPSTVALQFAIPFPAVITDVARNFRMLVGVMVIFPPPVHAPNSPIPPAQPAMGV